MLQLGPRPLNVLDCRVVDGQFSMPFCAAVVLRDGAMTWDSYAKHIGDADTLALCKKVQVSVDDRAQELFPDFMSGVVRVRTAKGEFETLVKVPLGEPENFMSDEQFRSKFDGLCEPYLGAERSGKLVDALLHLEEANSLRSVMELSQPA